MSLAEELLADLDEMGGEMEDEEYNEEDIMEADQQLEDLLKMADQSVKAVAKLNDSEQVSVIINFKEAERVTLIVQCHGDSLFIATPSTSCMYVNGDCLTARKLSWVYTCL